MATAKVDLNVDDGGSINKTTKNTKALRAELEAAAKAAESVRVPKAVAAARQGVANANAVNNTTSPKGGTQAFASTGGGNTKPPSGTGGGSGGGKPPSSSRRFSPGDQGDSNISRSLGPGTGAAARDFAKQASGLGGLVHVYATFAANLFAISSGFQALSRAQDAANMVKGLDQIGAASGRNLGSLAKQLVTATDGALSLRDAMTATAQATGGGLSGESLLRLGNVAKNASQALGRDMTDSISRLTRGITKLEPELLDELGILVRVDKASQDYARSLGKSTASLSQFEKQQAFANAVLSEGERKFGEINIDANPYQKILASLNNIATTGLTVINTVLTPILNILASSPTALAVAMAGISTLLIKQAVPAIGQWRKGLADSAEAARQAAIEASKLKIRKVNTATEKDVTAIYTAQQNAIIGTTKAVNDLKLAADSGFASKRTSVFKSIIGSPVDALDNKAVEDVKKRVGTLTKELAGDTSNLSRGTLASKKLELDLYNKINTSLETQVALTNKLEDSINEKAKTGLAKQLDIQNLNQKIIDKANARSQSINIVNTSAQNASTYGVITSFKKLGEQLRLARQGQEILEDGTTKTIKKMGLLDASLTGVKASVAITTAYVTTLASALSNVFLIVGIFVAVASALVSWLSKTGKEADNFSNALDNVQASADNVSRTLEHISKKSIEDIVSIESTQATANAINDLTDSFSKLSSTFDKLSNGLENSGFDKFIDNLWSLIGKGAKDKLADSISVGIKSGLDSIDDADIKTKVTTQLSAIFGGIKGKNVADSLSGLTNSEALGKLREVEKIFKDANKQINNTASNLTSFKQGLEETTKLVTQLNAEFNLNDAAGKLGTQLLGDSQRIGAALKEGPIKGLETINELMKNNASLSLLPEGTRQLLIDSKNDLDALTKQLATLTQRRKQAEAALASLQDKAATEPETTGIPRPAFVSAIIGSSTKSTSKIPEATEAVSNTVKELSSVENEIAGIISQFKGIDADIFKAGVEKLNASIKNAFAEAGVIAAKGYLSVIKSAGAFTAEDEAKLKQQEIAIQTQLLESNFSQVKALEKVSNQLEINSTNLALSRAKADIAAGDLSQETVDKVISLTNALNGLTTVAGVLSKSNSDIYKQLFGKGSNLKEGKSDEEVTAINGLIASFGTKLTSFMGQKAKLGAQAQVAKVETKAGSLKDENDRQKQLNDLKLAANAISLSEVSIQQEVLGSYDKTLANRKAELDIDNLKIKKLQEQGTLTTNLAILELGRGKAGVDQEKLKQAISIAQSQKTELNAKLERDIADLKIKNQLAELLGLSAIANKQRENQQAIKDFETSIAESKLTTQSDELTYLERSGFIDAASLATKRAKLELEGQALSVIKERGTAEVSYLSSVAELEARIAVARKNNQSAGDLPNQLEDIKNKYAAQRTAIEATNTAKTAGIELTKKQALEQEKINVILKDQANITNIMNNLADSLSDTFSKVGEAASSMAKVLADSAQSQIQYELDKKKLQEQSKNGTDEGKAQAIKELGDLEKKQSRDRLATDQAILASGRKAFNENSKFSKALLAGERVLAAFRVASALKDLFLTKAVTVAKVTAENTMTTSAVAGAEVRTSAATTESYANASASSANQGKGDPYTAFARVAAMVAIMAAITGKSMSTPKVGFTAENQQAVQGTGQSYVDGKLVDNGGGNFGDSSAKSEAVNKSIAMIEEHEFKNLEYSNEMLNALKAIKDNTSNLGKSLVRIPGLTTKPEPIEGGNWLMGKTSEDTVGKGIIVSGNIGQVRQGNASVDQYTNTKYTDKGFLGFIGGSTNFSSETKKLNNPAVTESIASVFNSVTDALVAAGKQLGTEGVEAFIDSLDISSSFKIDTLGKTGQEIVDDILAQIGIEMNIAAQQKFPELEKFRNLGEGYSETVLRVARDSQVVGLAFESMGLVLNKLPEHGTKATQSMIDAVTQAQTLVDSLLPATQVTREVTRAIQESDAGTIYHTELIIGSTEATKAYSAAQKQLADALEAVQKANNGVTTNTLDMVESLIDLSGGIDEFMTQSAFFRDNFLSASEKLAPVQKRVTEEMTRLGYASVDTRNEFKELVLGLDTTTEAGRVLYAALMQVAPGFTEVYASLDQISTEDLRKKVQDQVLEIAKLSGDANKVLQITREEAIKEFDKLDISDAERATLKDNQTQIFVLQDLASARKLETEAMQAAGASYIALTRQREDELKTLTREEQAIKLITYAQQDQAKTDALNIELLEAQGKNTEAIALKRKIELRGLSVLDAELKNRIYLLQDEKKLLEQKASQEVQIYTLLGNSVEALRITREQELATMDEQLKPSQLYIYALQDEATLKEQLKTAYEKESEALKKTITSMKDAIKTLKEYRESLLVGNLSTLTPAQKYAETKRQFLQTAAVATSVAITDEDKQAQADAVSKLPSLSDAFLEASRTLYASSASYTNDFSMVLDLLDTTSTALQNQQTDAEKQLEALDKNATILDIIKDNTKSTTELLQDIYLAQINTELAKTAAASSGSGAAGGTFTAPKGTLTQATFGVGASGILGADDTYVKGVDGWMSTVGEIKSIITASKPNKAADDALYASLTSHGITSSMIDAVLKAPVGTALTWAVVRGLPAFAKGGVAEGLSLVGEQGPELVDFKTPARVYNSSNTSAMMVNNAELIKELRALREEVKVLRQEQKEQTGHLITANYDANDRAARKVSESTENAANSKNWLARTMPKIA